MPILEEALAHPSQSPARDSAPITPHADGPQHDAERPSVLSPHGVGGSQASITEASTAADHALAQRERTFANDLTALASRLQGLSRKLLRDSTAAEDLVQETLLRAWRARDRFETGTNMRAWVFTILRNVHLSSIRRQRWVGEWSDKLEYTLASGEQQSVAVALKDVVALTNRLPLEQRAALELVGFEQLSYEEASAKIGIPIGTIKSRVARARATLAAMINGEGLPLAKPKASLARAVEDRPRVATASEPRASIAALWRIAKANGQPFLIG